MCAPPHFHVVAIQIAIQISTNMAGMFYLNFFFISLLVGGVG